MISDQKIFIALDLETTGFKADEDQIIEVAAVKFTTEKVLDTFDTLINPETLIPPVATQITGIDNQTVKGAPLFEDIKNQLAEFIGDHPIIGHNIQFDTGFLKAKGIPLVNKEYDTFEMSGLLLHGLPSYSLETISDLIGITHQNKHRALDDTLASMHLFNFLLARITELPAATLEKIQTLLQKSHWNSKPLFFLESEIHSPHTLNLSATQTTSLNSAIPELEQLLSSKENLIIEAPIKPNQISPNQNTKPIIHALAPCPSPDLDSPRNYLDLKKLEHYLANPKFTDSETTLLIRVLTWIDQTETGHKKEIKIYGEEHKFWPNLACSTPESTPQNSPENFFSQNFTRATQLEQIRISHQFLAEHAASPTPLLPKTERIIINQADQLEKNIIFAQTNNFNFSYISELFESAIPHLDIQNIIDQFALTLGLLGIYFEKQSSHKHYEKRIFINQELTLDPEWQKITTSLTNFVATATETLTSTTNLNDFQKNLATRLLFEINKIPQLLSSAKLETHLTFIHNENDTFGFRQSPLQPAPAIIQALEKQAPLLITSPSLLTDQNSNFISTTLGLNENYTIKNLPTPKPEISFSIPTELPNPNDKTYLSFCTKSIKNYVAENGGNTIIILSSRKAIELCFKEIALELKNQGLHLLCQNHSGSKGKILAKYSADQENSMIIATKYFWQKIKTENLSFKHQIIQKIPFDLLKDPWIEARSNNYSNSFADFLLPRATLDLKSQIQKFIQTAGTPKKLTFLDNRLSNKNYGQDILNSLGL